MTRSDAAARPSRLMRLATQLLTLASAEQQRQRTEIARLRNELAAAEWARDVAVQRAKVQLAVQERRHRDHMIKQENLLAHYEGRPHTPVARCGGDPCWRQ